MGIDFDKIAGRYDLINHVLSLGRDLRWRTILARNIQVCSPRKHLDLACGTGDQVAAVQRVMPKSLLSIGCDCSSDMLTQAAAKRSVDQLRVEWVAGDAAALPFEAASCDVITMSFGLRNMVNRTLVLKEMFRVLRPEGIVAMLEFSAPSRRFFPFRWYLRYLLPVIGGALSGQPKAYQYLCRSIECFPPPQTIVQEMEQAGFSSAKEYALDGGIVHMYTGTKT